MRRRRQCSRRIKLEGRFDLDRAKYGQTAQSSSVTADCSAPATADPNDSGIHRLVKRAPK